MRDTKHIKMKRMKAFMSEIIKSQTDVGNYADSDQISLASVHQWCTRLSNFFAFALNMDCEN